jgi:hypothetical protein
MAIKKALYMRQPGCVFLFPVVSRFYFAFPFWVLLKCQDLPIWILKMIFFTKLLFSVRYCLWKKFLKSICSLQLRFFMFSYFCPLSCPIRAWIYEYHKMWFENRYDATKIYTPSVPWYKVYSLLWKIPEYKVYCEI